MSAFTPEQEARLREIVREEIERVSDLSSIALTLRRWDEIGFPQVRETAIDGIAFNPVGGGGSVRLKGRMGDAGPEIIPPSRPESASTINVVRVRELGNGDLLVIPDEDAA